MIFSLSTQRYTGTIGTITDLLFNLFPKKHKSAAIILSFFERCFYKSKENKFIRLRHKAIAEATGLSLRTVVTWVNNLVADGWLLRKKSELAFSDFYLINTEKIMSEVEKLAGAELHAPRQNCTPSCKVAQELYIPANINKINNQEVFENQFFEEKEEKEEIPQPLLKAVEMGMTVRGNNKDSFRANIPPAPGQELDDEGEWCKDTTSSFVRPTEEEFVVREADRSEWLERAENCGVDFQKSDSPKELCLKVSLKRLINAVKALEQQFSNKCQARAIAQGLQVEGIDSSRFKIKNPNNFFTTALLQGWKNNTKSEPCYAQNGSGKVYEATMTVAEIKARYPRSQWLEAAEHFGLAQEQFT